MIYMDHPMIWFIYLWIFLMFEPDFTLYPEAHCRWKLWQFVGKEEKGVKT